MKSQLLIIVLLGLSLGTAATSAGAADISGTWAFSVNLTGGPQNVPMTFVFKQEGEKLTGTQSSGSGEPKVMGTFCGPPSKLMEKAHVPEMSVALAPTPTVPSKSPSKKMISS